MTSSRSFNPRSRASEQPAYPQRCFNGGLFQSTLARERTTATGGGFSVSMTFQSTLARERTTSGGTRITRLKSFQSTLARERTTLSMGNLPPQSLFQSTLARERTTRGGRCSPGYRRVSIHARARANNCPSHFGESAGEVSIHARARANNPLSWCQQRRWNSFNPRSRASEQHAPCSSADSCNGFNPRSRASEQREASQPIVDIYSFQSTLARERTTSSCSSSAPSLECFNPRSRASEQRHAIAGRTAIAVSIHARARANNGRHMPGFPYHHCFNPRSRASEQP